MNPNRIIKLQKLHEKQKYIYENLKRFNVIRCGRRFGKNVLAKRRIIKKSVEAQTISFIALDFSSQLIPFWRDCLNTFAPAIKHIDKQSYQIVLYSNNAAGECFVKFWSKDTLESMRGWSNDLIVFDEAASDKKLEEHYQEILLMTLADRNGGIDFLSTPKGYNYFKTLAEMDSPDWASFHFTSYDNPTIPTDNIKLLEDSMLPVVARQEIHADFVDFQGALIKREWLRYYDYAVEFESIAIGVDLAISMKTGADYTAIVVVGFKDENYYIVDCIRGQFTFLETQRLIIQTAENYSVERIAIESVAYQASIIQELRRTTNFNIISAKPDKDKLMRAMPFALQMQMGHVYLNTNLPKYYESELLSFPDGDHDDMVDATVYGFGYAKNIVYIRSI